MNTEAMFNDAYGAIREAEALTGLMQISFQHICEQVGTEAFSPVIFDMQRAADVLRQRLEYALTQVDLLDTHYRYGRVVA